MSAAGVFLVCSMGAFVAGQQPPAATGGAAASQQTSGERGRLELRVLPRPASPWITAAVGVRAPSVTPAHRLLLAALYETPEAWPENSPVRALWERGGTLEASAAPDGIVVVAEGAAADAELVLKAARAPLHLQDPSPLAVSRAQGRILRERTRAADERTEQSAREALWRRWFGHGAPLPRLAVSDIELHRPTADELAEAQARLSAEARAVMIVEGRLPEGLLDDAAGDGGPADQAGRGSGQAQSQSPALAEGARGTNALRPVPGPKLEEVAALVAAPTLIAGHPLPPAEADPLVDAFLVTALSTAEEPRVSARVERSRSAALLIVETPLAGREPAAALSDLAEGMRTLCERLRAEKEAAALAAEVERAVARAARTVGARARVAAHLALLEGGRADEGSAGGEGGAAARAQDAPEPDPAAVARAWLFPEVLRGVVVRPLAASPERGARSGEPAAEQ